MTAKVNILPTLRYKLKEIWRHGEAASVDKEAVAKEWERIAAILMEYDVWNQWNFDETSLFGL